MVIFKLYNRVISKGTSESTTLFYLVIILLVRCFSFNDLVTTSIKSTLSADVNEHFYGVDLPFLVNRSYAPLLT